MTIDIKALRDAWRLHMDDGVAEVTAESDQGTLACLDAFPRLLDALEAAERGRDAAKQDAIELRDVLRRANFSPCDVPACNCGSWHERTTGNGFYARFREIDEAIGSHDGMTTLRAVKLLVAERDALQGIVDDIASETGHCLLLDDEEHEAPTLPDWVRGIVKERDDALAELEACKAKLAALASYRIDHRLDCEFDPPNAKACTCGLDDLLAAAKEPTP